MKKIIVIFLNIIANLNLLFGIPAILLLIGILTNHVFLFVIITIIYIVSDFWRHNYLKNRGYKLDGFQYKKEK